MERIDLEDSLADLQHDLGKYIRLPLAWLDANANPVAIRQAAHTALCETRRSGGQVQSAAHLWSAFCLEVGTHLHGYSGWTTLTAAVQRALAWTERLDAIDRGLLQADLEAVAPAIRALLEEVTHG